MLISVQTPEAGGTAYAQFAAQWCQNGNGYLLNDTGTSLDVKIGVAASPITVANGKGIPFKLVYNCNELFVRRTDQATAQVTVEAQVGIEEVPSDGGGSAGGGGSTDDMAVIAAAATAAHNADAASHPLLVAKVSFPGFGTTGTTACVGNDSRLSDARTPLAHTQAWSTITSTPTTLSGYGISDAQPLDSDLTALSGLSTTGLVARTGTGTSATRTITGTANQITVTNGDGVAGNPTLSLPQDIATSSTPQFAKIGVGGAADATIPVRVYASAGNADAISVLSTAASGSDSAAHFRLAVDDGSAMSSGDRLGAIFFGGNDSAVQYNSASIAAYVTGNWTTNSRPSRLEFSTTSAANSRAVRLSILDTGNVGIGTTTPSTKLDVVGSGQFLHLSAYGQLGSAIGLKLRNSDSTNYNASQIAVYDSGGFLTAGINFRNISHGLSGSSDMMIGVRNSGTMLYPMYISSTGNVGIGTTSPISTLQVVGPRVGSGEVARVFSSDTLGAGIGGMVSLGGTYTGTAQTGFAAISGVKENGTDADYAGALWLQTRPSGGSMTTRLILSSTGALRLNAYGAGTLVTDSSGNVTASSDASLKTVTGTFTRGLADVLKLTPRTYHWNEKSGMDTEDDNVGFIAQEVLEAIPEAVGQYRTTETEVDGKKIKKREKAELLTLSDRPLIAALVNAVKELKAENDELRKRLDRLETKKLNTDPTHEESSTS